MHSDVSNIHFYVWNGLEQCFKFFNHNNNDRVHQNVIRKTECDGEQNSFFFFFSRSTIFRSLALLWKI